MPDILFLHFRKSDKYCFLFVIDPAVVGIIVSCIWSLSALGVEPWGQIGFPREVVMQVIMNGHSVFQGGKGSFNLLQSTMDKAVLAWLRADPVLHRCAKSNGWVMDIGEGKDRRGENGVKLELCGHLGSNTIRPNLSLNGKDAAAPQWARWRAWAAAWRQANAIELQAVQAKWHTALKAMTPQELGLNGQAFLDNDILDWVADLGAMQLMSPTDRSDPQHYDGGASFIHLGVTLFGSREICFQVRESDDVLRLVTGPGHVYLGSLCSALHHVEHKKQQAKNDLLAQSSSITIPVWIPHQKTGKKQSLCRVGGSSDPKLDYHVCFRGGNPKFPPPQLWPVRLRRSSLHVLVSCRFELLRGPSDRRDCVLQCKELPVLMW